MESLKNRLKKNELTIGSWINLAHPAIPEIMADAGFDWLVVDLEHSAITIREAEDLIRIIDLKKVIPLVRLTSNDPNLIKRVMDAGAQGVIVPMVNTKEQAEAAVRAVRYPPFGNRGVGLARAQGYGFKFEEYARWINRESVVIAQIEHVGAIHHLQEILDVDGIDATIIGPYDLSGSLGKPGRFDDEDVQEQLQSYERISKGAGKPLGYHIVQPVVRLLQEKIEAGYRFLAFGTDFLFLGTACRERMKKIKRS